ncbi:MAG: hypothetical protein JNK81_13525 [Anaerolineales bacterium]|nr:hypothetical protein [Anaerolineales bacterium]
MDTPHDKNIRRNSIIVAFLIIAAIFGILAFIPSNSIASISAIVAITISIALPIHQKHFSFYSILFIIIGVLFILSGAIRNTADNFLDPLSISSQIEFSKIMRPKQVSMGLWNVGIGMCNAILAWVWLKSFKNIPPRSKVIAWAPLILCGIAILFIILGVSSIMNGLSRL